MLNKFFYKLLLPFFVITFLQAAPWDIDPQQRELLLSRIEDKHRERIQLHPTDYFEDHVTSKTNFTSSSCTYCQTQNSSQYLEMMLKKSDFQKIPKKSVVGGHCVGITFLFTKFILSQQLTKTDTCSQILSKIALSPNFMKESHEFSVNQPCDYVKGSKEINPADLPPQLLLKNLVWLNPSYMREFLKITIGQSPEEYYFYSPSRADSSKFNTVAIYATLQKLPNKLLLISYNDKKNAGHCIAICTNPEKILFFDSNDGLYQFHDLETMSWVCGKTLDGCKLQWIATFSLPTK